MARIRFPIAILALLLLNDTIAFRKPPALVFRGGNLFSKSNENRTVEEYVAAMKEKDGHDDSDMPEDEGRQPNVGSTDSTSRDNETDQPAIVGVKSHTHKKSNAVGDPDGDDDDDSDASLSEYSEEWEELDAFDGFIEDVTLEPQVQVEVEVVEEDATKAAVTTGGGGVGVRLGRMNQRRRNKREAWRSTATKLSQHQKRLLEAWLPHVYFPPTEKALSYLSDNARLLDASSKNRLDRRTLYAGLMLEWGSLDGKLSSNTRKFLQPATSQALQAALSMATQPKWRQSAPRTSGIRLYEDDDDPRASTLAMQETITMALVSNLTTESSDRTITMS